MRVINLLGDRFGHSCQKLCDIIRLDYKPDIIIGVLTGGGYVGKEMSQYISQYDNHKYIEVRLQRKDTKKKEKGIRYTILQSLPFFLLNWLRMLEMIIEDMKAKKSNPTRVGSIELPENIDVALKSEKQNVLIVDDAIDTGATLRMIYDTLSSRYPLAIMRIAVITVTSNHPLIDADYCLFHDRTLVRFPWSNDVKKKK